MSRRYSVTQTNREAKKLLKAMGGCCYICGLRLTQAEMNKDHVFPRSGGFSLNGNMMPAHERCNSEKENNYPTFRTIEKIIEVYESIGLTFDPYVSGYKKIVTKPLIGIISRLERSQHV